MFSLNSKTVVVNGAAGLIGRTIANCMLKQGADVVMLDLNEESLKLASDELNSTTSSGQTSYHVCDVTNEEQIQKTIKSVIEVNKKIDILVNNAGITRDMLFARMKPDDYDAVMNINLKSVFLMTQNVLPNMISNRFGRIINISSIVGFTGNIGQANYCASKAGMVGMTKAIAQEVARRNITVNCIAPGFIKSAMTDGLSDNIKAKLVEKIPVGYIGDAEHVAHAACFLASDEASYITGQTLHVNGGMAMI